MKKLILAICILSVLFFVGYNGLMYKKLSKLSSTGNIELFEIIRNDFKNNSFSVYHEKFINFMHHDGLSNFYSHCFLEIETLINNEDVEKISSIINTIYEMTKKHPDHYNSIMEAIKNSIYNIGQDVYTLATIQYERGDLEKAHHTLHHVSDCTIGLDFEDKMNLIIPTSLLHVIIITELAIDENVKDLFQKIPNSTNPSI